MAPSPAYPDPLARPERPTLLNEKFKVHSYDGGSFKSRAQYDVKNVLIPIIEPFHCSCGGTKFNLILKCSEDFTLTHFYVSGPGPRCTEPIKSGLVWVLDAPPEVDSMKRYDNMTSEELMEIMKGLRSHDHTMKESGGLPAPSVYFTTDLTSREAEVELPKWREGKYVAIKFLDTHKDQVNIDVGIIGLIGFFGRHAQRQIPLGPWMRRSVKQVWVHPNPLRSMFSSSGWVCDGRDFTGGCRSGQTDFHQTTVYTVTFRCQTSGFDLCEKCAYDPSLGRVTETSLQSDIEALSDPATCKLAVARFRNLWRRTWLETLPQYIQHGFLEALVQALTKSTEGNGKPGEEGGGGGGAAAAAAVASAGASRQQSGPEAQRRQARRALLQLTTELTQCLLGLGAGGDIAPNDLVWALSYEPEEHWEEGRVVELPKTMWGAPSYTHTVAVGTGAAAVPASAEPAAAVAAEPAAAAAPAGDVAASEGSTANRKPVDAETGFLISWRDGQGPVRVHPRNVWKMSADEDVMSATANLFQEVSKGPACDPAAVTKYLQHNADLMAVNGEGCPTLVAAVRGGVPVEVFAALLEGGACPDVAGRDGATPLQVALRRRREAMSAHDGAAVAMFGRYAEELRRRGACGPPPDDDDVGATPQVAEQLLQLRQTFGLKMVSSLLTLQTPAALPVEVLEVIHMLFRELPQDILQKALEPQAFRALASLLQHFVGSADSLSAALVGCRIMRAIWARGDLALRTLVRSHGVPRWARRLAATRDVAQCGLYRNPHHEKVTPEELCKEAKALCEEIAGTTDAQEPEGEEWRANSQLAEIASALDPSAAEGPDPVGAAKEALVSFRELLKKTEKGSLNEERCAAYELERSGVPGRLLRLLKFNAPAAAVSADHIRQPVMNHEQWAYFREVFSEQTKQTRKGLTRLMKAMHAVVETGESFPVWRHKKERGLRALTEPLPLKLRRVEEGNRTPAVTLPFTPKNMRPQVSVMVEPLASIGDLSRYLLRVTPSADERYLAYCHMLVGATICDKASGDRSTVLAFEVLLSDLPLPIHTVRRQGSDETQRVLLGLRDYVIAEPSPNAATASASDVELRVALSRLHVLVGSEAYAVLLDEISGIARGDEPPPVPAPRPPSAASGQSAGGEAAVPPPSAAELAKTSDLVQQAMQQIISAAKGDDAWSLLDEEMARIVSATGGPEGADGAAAAGGAIPVDPTMRVHTVMIAVSDEIPFELFWPMVRDDIMGAVRELYPRGVPNMEDAVQQGVTQNGMGPIAQRLTLEEAETLAARVGHVVQTAVTVDPQAVQDLQRERSKSTTGEAAPVSGRVQFSPRSGESWISGVIVGHGPPGTSIGGGGAAGGAAQGKGNEKLDIIDDKGVLWDRLPRGRVRPPPGRREPPSPAGTPIQAVLSQADLVRIREHLRRRQEEWAERHAQMGGPGGPGGPGAPGGAGGPAAASVAALVGGPAGSSGPRGEGFSAGVAAAASGGDRSSSSRPTSAPAAGAPVRSRQGSGPVDPPGGGGGGAVVRRGASGSDILSREGSIGEVDPTLEMVHFIEEGIADEDSEDDGDGGMVPGDDGEEDDEDLPALEPSEAGDSTDAMPPPRLGGARLRDGESRDSEGGSMEELRVLEQLRAMERIISEVLDPQDASGRQRRDPGGGGGGGGGGGQGGDDFLAPMANLRIRMGGGADGRVETYQIRRASGSRGSERTHGLGMEAIRGDFPSFVRAADAPNPTSSLDHPVVERLGAADLVEEETSADDPMEPALGEPGAGAPQLIIRFCLMPLAAPEPTPAGAGSSTAAAAAPAPAPAPGAAAAGAAGTDSAPQQSTPPPPPPPPPLPPMLAPQPASAPIALPSSWNLLKAMQFLQDQQHLRGNATDSDSMACADAAATSAGAPPCVVQALQKVDLASWCLGYVVDVGELPSPSAIGGSFSCEMEVDHTGPEISPRRKHPGASAGLPVAGRSPGAGLPAKKRRRTQSGHDVPDEVAREMYSRFQAEAVAGGGALDEAGGGPQLVHGLIAKCSESAAVTDAIELLHLLKSQGASLGVESSLWISPKLDRKLRYQLEDPLSVVSGTLPLWATTLPRLCPFLFSLKTRKMLLKYTAFGPSFAVHWTQDSKVGSFLRRRATVQTELNAQTDPRKIQELSQELSNIEEHVVKSNFWLGTLQSTLVRMTKGDELLKQSDVAMELVSASSNLVEVQFDGETGFGSAVTQSFYVEVAQGLQDRETNRRTPMWVEDDESGNSQFLLCRRGLMIRPLVEGPQRDEAVRRFRFLGRLMGQALREGFIAPLPLAEEFFALVLGEQLTPSSLPRPGGGSAGELVGVLADFAAELTAGEANMPGASQEQLRAWRAEQAARLDFGETLVSHDRTEGSPQQQMSFAQYVSLVGVSFLETGLSGAPLFPGGEDVKVTVENVREFVDQATRFWFETGIVAQVDAFRAGLNDVFPFECLVAFSRTELREMFCGEDRIEWNEQALLAHFHPLGGLTEKSATYKFLVAELLEMSQADRARFLDFVSSCPRLPPGGIAKFHVDVFPDTTASKQGFPRSRACANQLYLPPYSSKEELHEKLHEAMHCSVGHHEQRVRDQ